MTALSQRCPWLEQDAQLFGFSYGLPGKPYDRDDTWFSITQHTVMYQLLMAGSAGRIVQIGFSLGTNVVLLGASSLPEGSRVIIPAIILIAPVHRPDPDLLRQYENLPEQFWPQGSSTRPDVPVPVREFCAKGSTWPDRVEHAYRQLLDRQIPIHLVLSEDDSFTRYELPKLSASQRALVSCHSVTPPKPPLDETREIAGEKHVQAEVTHHLRLRLPSNDRVLDTVCEILARYLP